MLRAPARLPRLLARPAAAAVHGLPEDGEIAALRELTRPHWPWRNSRFTIAAEEHARLMSELGWSSERLLRVIVKLAEEEARPPVSNFNVGSAALGESGTIYLGVNLEIAGHRLSSTVHGEQFSVLSAMKEGEQRLTHIAANAVVCGHCRQFLRETAGSLDMKLLMPGVPEMTLDEALPHSFGPADLGVDRVLLAHGSVDLEMEESGKEDGDAAVAAALQAAKRSYAPYSHAYSGLAFELKDGRVCAGSYVENAAFNPTMTVYQSALVALRKDAAEMSDVARAVLVHVNDDKLCHPSSVESMVAAALPGVGVEEYIARCV